MVLASKILNKWLSYGESQVGLPDASTAFKLAFGTYCMFKPYLCMYVWMHIKRILPRFCGYTAHPKDFLLRKRAFSRVIIATHMVRSLLWASPSSTLPRRRLSSPTGGPCAIFHFQKAAENKLYRQDRWLSQMVFAVKTSKSLRPVIAATQWPIHLVARAFTSVYMTCTNGITFQLFQDIQ
jgi:hypothetical protein